MNGAVVLAGGYSCRFGEVDKTVVDLAGKPMIRRVVETVGPMVDELVVSLRSDQTDRIETALEDCETPYRFAIDEVSDRGPLAGLVWGLEATDAEYALVVACDMPFVDPTFVKSLFDRAAGRDAAIPVERNGDEEWLQPLQAVYRTDRTLQVARSALEEGISSPATAVGRLDYVTVTVESATPGGDGWTLRNVNTEPDLEEAEGYFDRPSTDGESSNFVR